MRGEGGGGRDDQHQRVLHDGGGPDKRAGGVHRRVLAGGGHAAHQVRRPAAAGGEARVLPAGPAHQAARRHLPPLPRRLLLPRPMKLTWTVERSQRAYRDLIHSLLSTF